MKLSIVIPAYNEERRLPPTLEAYLPYFAKKYANDFEIVVVVNGSKDRTDDVARFVAVSWSQLKVIVEPKPIGKGGAIILGFRNVTGDLVGFVDADGSTPPSALQDLVEHIDDAGAIIASRWFKESVVVPRQPFKRRLVSRIFNGMVRSLFKLRITDTQCGAKVMTRDAIEEVLPKLGLTRWAFDVDLLFQLRRAGYRIKEHPTTWHDVGGSQLRIFRASVEMFLAICRLRLIYSPFRWIVYFYDKTLGRFFHKT